MVEEVADFFKNMATLADILDLSNNSTTKTLFLEDSMLAGAGRVIEK